MNNTEIFENVTIVNHLNIPNDLKKFFCNILYDRTKGLPRLVHKALEGINETNFDQK